MPSYSDLQKQFNYVSDLFRDDVVWKTHPSLEDQEPLRFASLDRMELIHFNRSIESEEVIKEMAEKGYRPATHLELIAWAEKNPYEQKKHCIVALGSSTMFDDYEFVAMLGSDSDRRVLGSVWFVDGWDSDLRFLFVRKKSSGAQTLGHSALPDGTLSLRLLIKATEAFLEVLKGGLKK